ncbi:MAG TPA: hypothetical protein VFN19_07180 [Candidatus Nanopelagicales bacterium]|jgi:hypothetical protein|nr:hypothetical protein [Candidatus Nanopelagicales bacterium]
MPSLVRPAGQRPGVEAVPARAGSGNPGSAGLVVLAQQLSETVGTDRRVGSIGVGAVAQPGTDA